MVLRALLFAKLYSCQELFLPCELAVLDFVIRCRFRFTLVTWCFGKAFALLASARSIIIMLAMKLCACIECPPAIEIDLRETLLSPGHNYNITFWSRARRWWKWRWPPFSPITAQAKSWTAHLAGNGSFFLSHYYPHFGAIAPLLGYLKYPYLWPTVHL